MRYLSKLGYQIGDDGIDTYGVNHNDFTINDELRYQTARIDRENQLINSYNNMGIKDNYPIYTTNFWGSTSDNNYGFGNMNIREAIDNHSGINQSPLPMQNFNQTQMQTTVPSYWNKNTVNNQQINNTSSELMNIPNYHSYTILQPNKFTSKDIFLAGITGWGEGIEAGISKAMDVATLGGYNLLNYYYLGNQYENMQNSLQRQAEINGLGRYNKLANSFIDWGVGGKLVKKLGKTGVKYFLK